MMDIQDPKTKERVNIAIGNIRLIATRVKRASVQDAKLRAEIVVGMLNEFRQYINVFAYRPDMAGKDTPFKHDKFTLSRMVQATFQADTIYSLLARSNKKKYEHEYRQVWNLLENIHAYLQDTTKRG